MSVTQALCPCCNRPIIQTTHGWEHVAGEVVRVMDTCPDCGHGGEHHMSDPERAHTAGCFQDVDDPEAKLGIRRCGCPRILIAV